MYTVQLEGIRDKLYAAPSLHKELQAAGVGPDSVFTITKVEGDGNRKGWLVQPEGQNACRFPAGQLRPAVAAG